MQSDIKLKSLSKITGHDRPCDLISAEIDQLFGQKPGCIYAIIYDGWSSWIIRRSHPDQEPEAYYCHGDEYQKPPYSNASKLTTGYTNVGEVPPFW